MKAEDQPTTPRKEESHHDRKGKKIKLANYSMSLSVFVYTAILIVVGSWFILSNSVNPPPPTNSPAFPKQGNTRDVGTTFQHVPT